MAKQQQGRQIAPGESVFEHGRFYVAGQEDELHEAYAAGDAKAARASIAHLTKSGLIAGFGVASPTEAQLASDPTLQAGEYDAVLEDDGEAPRAEMGEVVHRDGLYSAEQGRKGGKGGKK